MKRIMNSQAQGGKRDLRKGQPSANGLPHEYE